MNKLDYNKLNIVQKQNLILKLNYKRYKKFRLLLIFSFIIGLILCLQFKFNSFDLSKVSNIITLILIIIYFTFSIPFQVYFYYTKLPTKNYEIILDSKNIKFYLFYLIISAFNYIWFIFNLKQINLVALILYTCFLLILYIYNLYLIFWIKKVFIIKKDRYYLIIKDLYLSLKKNDRQF